MSKGNRIRQRRRQEHAARQAQNPNRPPGPPRGARRIDLGELLTSEHVMPCRLTYLGDPAITGYSDRVYVPVRDIVNGTVIADHDNPLDSFPVVLFEPDEMFGIRDGRTGTMHEFRTEGLISNGFHRIPAGPMIAFQPADNCGLYRTKDGVMLSDHFGGIWAQGHLPLDPQWVSAATDLGFVGVLMAPHLGLRAPASPATEDQAGGLQRSRVDGLCVAAMVQWHPTARHETTKWVLYPAPGPDQAPMAYVPQRNFTPHGGPEQFGFRSLAGAFTPTFVIPDAKGLVGEVTPTDFDLFRPELDHLLGFVTGYHARARDPFFAQWQQSARRHGHVMIVTGHQDMPGACELPQFYEICRDSYGAFVPLRPSTGG